MITDLVKSCSKRVFSIVLSGAFLVSSIGMYAFAVKTNADDSNSEKNKNATASAGATDSEKDTAALSIDKDETVYVIANADGSAKKVIVSDWLKNSGSFSSVTDKSSLQNIVNVKGNEKYTVNENGMKIWATDGEDICYQGTSNEELPVTLGLTYYLNGEKIAAEDIAGKSGEVKIRFDYDNNCYENVVINGKTEKIYVPFLMLSGLMLDNDNFSNVEVTNGKMINDGDRTVVVGMALPGLQHDLGIDASDFEIPDYVEITATTKKFELTTTMTIATNELFNNIDLDNVDTIDDLKSSMNDLTGAMNKLMDGSSELYNGLNTLLSKSDDLIAGVKKLNAGAKKLSNGAKKLSDGAGELNTKKSELTSGAKQLSSGATELSSGLSKLTSNNTQLNSGAKKVYNSLLSQVYKTITDNGITIDKLTISNYSEVLSSLIKKPDSKQQAELIDIAKAQLNERLAAVPEDYYDATLVMLSNKMASGVSLEKSITQITNILTDAGTVSTVMASSAISPDATVKGALLAKGYDEATATTIAKVCTYLQLTKGGSAVTYINTAAAMAQNAATVVAAASDANATTKINGLCLNLAKKTLEPTITGAKSQLDEYGEFYKGVNDYTKGAADAYSGSKKLSSGAKELNSGAKTVSGAIGEIADAAKKISNGAADVADGTEKLDNSTGALKSGVKKLTDGAMQLSNGLSEFNEKGVQKLVDLSNDFDSLLERLKAIKKVSGNYKTFSGTADDMGGSVKFVYKTDSIEPTEDEESK